MLAYIIPIPELPAGVQPLPPAKPGEPAKPGQPPVGMWPPIESGQPPALPTHPIVIMPPSAKPLPPDGGESGPKPPADGSRYVWFYVPGHGGQWVEVGKVRDLISTLPAETPAPK